ncbi:MAG: DUF4168 domain-containing protein [Cyanobacteria bacterium J06638_20]
MKWAIESATQRWMQGWKRAIALLLCIVFCWGFLAGGLGMRAPAFAAVEDTPTVSEDSVSTPPPTNPATEDISTEKVSQFVHAYLQVLALVDEREGDLQAAETQLESLRLQQEMEAEAFAIIEDSGLTLQEYLQLLGLANTDPEFGERVATQLQEPSR